MDVSTWMNQAIELQRNIRASGQKAAVMFADMAGSTRYKHLRPPEQGVMKTWQFNLTTTRVVTEQADGDAETKCVICKYIGDEVMVWFQGPRAAQKAVETAVAIQRAFDDMNREIPEPLDQFYARIGIDLGDVYFFHYGRMVERAASSSDATPKDSDLDPQGPIVDRAARVASISRPQQILVSEALLADLPADSPWEISPITRRKFKGVRGEIGVAEISWQQGQHQQRIGLGEEKTLDTQTGWDIGEILDDLQECRQVDIYAYTGETLMAQMQPHLMKRTEPLRLRVLLRAPSAEDENTAATQLALVIMKQIMRANRVIRFEPRLYPEPPLLRLCVFHKDKGTEGLVGIYYYDKRNPRRFLGEDTDMVCCRQRSELEKRLLKHFRSRFEYAWETARVPDDWQQHRPAE